MTLFADFIIGAPGYNVTGVTSGPATAPSPAASSSSKAAFVPLNRPAERPDHHPDRRRHTRSPRPVVFTRQRRRRALQIFVFSNAAITPPFAPVTEINPATVVVNGVAFPNATLAQDPVDENKDGIPDAIITITPRSALGLTTSTTSRSRSPA